MFTAECLSPNLFAEYWLATGVVQRLRPLAMRLSRNWRNIVEGRRGTRDLPLWKAKFPKGQVFRKAKFLEREILERPGSR
jgi:hypothetical protein